MIDNFDPNSLALEENNIFGLPTNEDNAKLIIIPVPWEVTVSYRNGTARGPEEILEASRQVDLYDSFAHNMWKHGYYMPAEDKYIIKQNDYFRHCAELIIADLVEGGKTSQNIHLEKKLKEVNKGCEELVGWVEKRSSEYLNKNKLVALVGGDHSTPLGLLKALSKKYKEFGILQIDAHMDFRNAYEGFTYSHASIMYNVLNQIPEVKKLVQVGIRDYSDTEVEFAQSQKERVEVYYDQAIKERQFDGESWKSICEDIVEKLPEYVYISFDIDGLDPKLCANTGTPVYGGFEVDQILYLFRTIINKGKKIISFDLNEVACGELTQDSLDANIGAHILYKMCNMLVKSNMEG